MYTFSLTLPSPWYLTHLILLDPEWQANISDGEYVAVGTGVDIPSALLAAAARAENGKTCGRLFHLGRLRMEESKGLSQLLDKLIPPKEPIRRRV